MPAKVCLLHIGAQKTGSSAVQRWFNDNIGKLESDGVFYSRTLGRVAHPFIVSLFSEYDPQSAITVDTGCRSAEQFAAWKKNKVREFEDELESFKNSSLKFFVISHENLSRLNRDAVIALKELIEPHFDEVTVAGFLRPDAELARSWISTHARNGREIGESFFENFTSRNLDMVRSWNGVFDSTRWIPLRRSKGAIAPLTKFLELDETKYALDYSANERLDSKMAILLAHLRLPLFIDGARNANRRTFFEDTSFDEPVQISRAQAETIQDRHLKRNEEIVAMCEGIELADLAPDLDAFPEEGNFSDHDEPVYIDRLREVIVRLNVQINLEKCRSNMLQCELQLVRGQDEMAAEAHSRAMRNLLAAKQVKFPSVQDEILRLQERLRTLGGKISDLPA